MNVYASLLEQITETSQSKHRLMTAFEKRSEASTSTGTAGDDNADGTARRINASSNSVDQAIQSSTKTPKLRDAHTTRRSLSNVDSAKPIMRHLSPSQARTQPSVRTPFGSIPHRLMLSPP